MVPATKDLTLYRGDSFDLPVRLRQKLINGSLGDPVDLTGCTVDAEIRSTEDEAGVVATFGCDLDADPTTGIVTLSLTKVETAALTGGGVWDMQITFPDGKTQTYLAGKVYLTKDVTRP